MSENTSAAITEAEKDAYSKGWASTAKTLDSALAGAVKKYGEGAAVLNFFQDGYEDKASGSKKWDALTARKLEAQEPTPTAVEVDGVTVAEVRHIDLDADLAAEAAVEGKEAPESEAPAEAEEAPAPKAEVVPEGHVSILSLLRTITADQSKEERAAIRAEVAIKKNHYKMGWNSQQSPLFNGHDQAQAGYLKRRPGSPYLGDWEAGYDDHEEDREFGHSWKELVSTGSIEALHAEMTEQGE